jgi:hypothetical protein
MNVEFHTKFPLIFILDWAVYKSRVRTGNGLYARRCVDPRDVYVCRGSRRSGRAIASHGPWRLATTLATTARSTSLLFFLNKVYQVLDTDRRMKSQHLELY